MTTNAKKLTRLAVALLDETADNLPDMQQKLEELSGQITRFEQRKEDALWAGDAEKANGIGYQIILRYVARKELKRRIKNKLKEEADDLQQM